MPFRTGPQTPIGNGSTLMILGTCPMLHELAGSLCKGPGTWVHFVAHIEAENDLLEITRIDLAKKHARAIWKYCSRYWYNQDFSNMLVHPNKYWVRVAYRTPIKNDLRDPASYLQSEGRKVGSIWPMVRYIYSGESSGNRVLGIHDSTEIPLLPIQPGDIRLVGKEDAEQISLGFSGVTEQVAKLLLKWMPRRQDWKGFGGGMYDNVTEMNPLQFKQGLRDLHQSGFVHLSNEQPLEWQFRESFVVKCWNAVLDS